MSLADQAYTHDGVTEEGVRKLIAAGFNVVVPDGAALGLEEGGTAVTSGSALLGRYENVLLDCDGVLWSGSHVFDRVVDVLAFLKQEKKRVLFVTNNSGRSRATYRQKMGSLGIEASTEDILPTSFAAASFLKENHPEIKKAYVVGGRGLCDELEAVGVATIGCDDGEYVRGAVGSEKDFNAIKKEKDVNAVVCGWDLTFNFYKLCVACIYLQDPNILFLATNRDAWDRVGDRRMPGNGALVSSIEGGTGREAVCVGKPTQWLADFILRHYGFDSSKCIMIGDRLDTDIQLGKRAGMATALTLTGCTSVEELLALGPHHPDAPMYVLPHVGQLSLLPGCPTVAARAKSGSVHLPAQAPQPHHAPALPETIHVHSVVAGQ